jgi:hypothetical protein
MADRRRVPQRKLAHRRGHQPGDIRDTMIVGLIALAVARQVERIHTAI